jgi:uncharacterized protein (DUF488 family)
MTATIYTIGHSTRSVAELAGLIRQVAVDLLVDVRSVPRSRANPQFNADALPASLAELNIAYRHLPALGGLRGRPKGGALSANTMWRNDSFRNYADYAQSAAFREGLDALVALSQHHCCAIMCAEAVWWRCHRRIISDYLLTRGVSVAHIMGPGTVAPATPTPGLRRLSDGGLAYPAAASAGPLFDGSV